MKNWNKSHFLLAIETSCDDTAAAIISMDGNVCADIVHTQQTEHAAFGGVVPEIASRAHLVRIAQSVQEALAKANLKANDISAVAATFGPGLIGALMVGFHFAKGFAQGRNIPFLGIHHIEGHIMAGSGEDGFPEFPFIALVVSGGHCCLYICDEDFKFRVIGQTRDDAPGEAFDKIGRKLGFGYPAGKSIDECAKNGNEYAYPLPVALKETTTLDYSFSGLKTAAVNLHAKFLKDKFTLDIKADFCASLQKAIADALLTKAFLACKQHSIPRLLICGGVAANSKLREEALKRGSLENIHVFVTPKQWCTDNAVMIAKAARRRLLLGQQSSLSLDAQASMVEPIFYGLNEL